MSDAADRIAEIEARRAARKAMNEVAYQEQRAVDLERLDALEVEHGDSNVACVDIDYQGGSPTMAIVVAPNKTYVKRYQDRVRPKRDGRAGDPQAAAEELATVCVCYPDKDVFEFMVDARPGLRVQCGLAALRLAVGREQELGKG